MNRAHLWLVTLLVSLALLGTSTAIESLLRLTAHATADDGGDKRKDFDHFALLRGLEGALREAGRVVCAPSTFVQTPKGEICLPDEEKDKKKDA